MRIKTKDLQAVLKNFAGVELVMFSPDRISFCQDNNMIVSEIPCDINIIVPFKELYELVSKTKETSLLLTVDEESLKIKGRTLNAGIKAVIEQQNLPVIPDEFFDLPPGFNAATKLALYTVGKNDDILGCVNFTPDYIISSDDLRITRVKFKSPFICLLKGIYLKNEFKMFADTDLYIFLKTESGTIYGIRKFDGDYHDVANFFDFESSIIELPAGIIDLIESSSVFTDDDSDYSMKIEIQITDGILKIRSENDHGWAETSIKTELQDDLRFVVNPKFLHEVLKISNKAIIGENRFLIRHENLELLTTLFLE